MNINFFDTEFYENGSIIDLISIGVVKPDGSSFYMVNSEHNRDKVKLDCELNNSDTYNFLNKNVYPTLNATKYNYMPLHFIAAELQKFLKGSPIMWASTASYDWLVVCQLFGRMLDIPKDWLHHPMDTAQLKQLFPEVKKDFSLIPPPEFFNIPQTVEHNALYDAYETYVKYASYKKYFETIGLKVNM